MKHEVLAVVPYRDREEHLNMFIAHMQKYYPSIDLCVIEQTQGKPFNRAKLLNIGYLQNQNYKKYIFHDVDMLPFAANYYLAKYHAAPVVQLASSNIQRIDYLGGVTRFTNHAFKASGGYNNEYFHRAEDNEMMFNLKRLGIRVLNKPGKYHYLQHERKGPEFDPALWAKAQQPRIIQNQLTVCQYEVIVNAKLNNGVRHIIAAI
jgi:hypothetical protein